MPGSSTLSLVLALLCTIAFVSLATKYWSLRRIPGPFWAKFTNLQRVYYVMTGLSHKIHQRIHEYHGDVVRLGPNMVSVADPDAVATIYPTRPGFPKSKFYNAFIPFTKTGSLPTIFTVQDEQLHKQLKSPVAPLYSLTNVVTMEPFVNTVMGIFFNELDLRFGQQRTPFDLSDWLQFFAFDVMATMTFSRRYGFLEEGQDRNGMFDAIWKFMLTIAPMTQVPWFDKLWNKNSFAIRFKKPVGNSIMKVAAESVSRRQSNLKEKKAGSEADQNQDFLAKFLDVQDSNPSLPPWATMAWTFSNVIAGSDSTAVVMKTTMYHILANDATRTKLQQELADAMSQGKLTKPYPRWAEVCNLPYLDACVHEAIRLHPPFCLQFERIVPAGGLMVCDKFLPEGTVVGMNPYVVNRHKGYYGKDADQWRPERWLGLSEDEKRRLEQGIMTFGAGRRVCLGKNVALLEIKKILPALLINYQIDLIDPTAYVTENSYFFRQRGIYVNLRRL